jgi:DNA replication and repair protein RecF
VLVTELRLTDFRSYAQLTVAFPRGPQVIVGPNAAGKTNLLEALVVLAWGRSHRTRVDGELVRWDAPLARLEAWVTPSPDSGASADPLSQQGALLQIVIPGLSSAGLSDSAGMAAAGLRKQVRVDGVTRRAEALASHLRTVIFSPEAMLLVAGPPSLRRDELDMLASQLYPSHRRALAAYGRALAQRNSLLRLIREERASRDELHYWDRVLAEEGGAVVEARLRALAEVSGPLAAAHADMAPREPPLAIWYAASAAPRPGESATAALRRRLAETADKELWNGMTLVGPHRDDAVFRLGDRELAACGSRGQQRTAILALKLAELQALARAGGSPPLLLLDDVFSELDPDRRAHLIGGIAQLPQAFVTTTTLADLDAALLARATTWEAVPGKLVAVGR